MPEPSLQSDPRAELLDRLRHALQYARESERMLMDALHLLEAEGGDDA